MATSPLPWLWHNATMGFCLRIPVVRALALAVVVAAAQPVAAQCLLCDTAPVDSQRIERAAGEAAAEQPLRVEIAADLDFARLVAGQAGGSVRIDPSSGGAVTTGDVRAASGIGFSGRMLIVGTAGRMVRVDLADAAVLTSATGGTIHLSDISTGQPPVLRLGPDGRLDLPFGGQLAVSGAVDGDFRGRIAVTVSYE